MVATLSPRDVYESHEDLSSVLETPKASCHSMIGFFIPLSGRGNVVGHFWALTEGPVSLNQASSCGRASTVIGA